MNAFKHHSDILDTLSLNTIMIYVQYDKRITQNIEDLSIVVYYCVSGNIYSGVGYLLKY